MQLCQSTLVKTDAEMIRMMSIVLYFNYIFRTICGSGFGDRVGKGGQKTEGR